MSQSRQYCTFLMESALFGIEIERVQEIIRFQDLTRIPLAPPLVAGLINLRGQIVPALDLRSCLSMSGGTPNHEATNVIIQTVDGAVSLLVDSIGDILTLPGSAFELPPTHLHGAVRTLIRGVYKLTEGLMMVLSIEDVISLATQVVEPA
jgi:purine-binding chemotaxis protein CheW